METKIKFFNLRAKVCSSLFLKFRGMMFSCKKAKPLLFVFKNERKVSIHMFFVFMPLLVIWLDDKKRIVEFKVLRPFEISNTIGAKYVLEIPADRRFMNSTKIRKGLKLNFRI